MNRSIMFSNGAFTVSSNVNSTCPLFISMVEADR